MGARKVQDGSPNLGRFPTQVEDGFTSPPGGGGGFGVPQILTDLRASKSGAWNNFTTVGPI
jgi:hypothetical protein